MSTFKINPSALFEFRSLATLYFGPSGFSSPKLKQNGSSVLDKAHLLDRSSEQTAKVDKQTAKDEEQASEVKDQVIGQVILRATGPSWVTLRRNGQVEYKGKLEGERVINKPVEIEIYTGRPDLVEVSAKGLPTRTVGTIDDIRWLPLMP